VYTTRSPGELSLTTFSVPALPLYDPTLPQQGTFHTAEKTHTYTAHELAPPVWTLFKNRTCWFDLGMIINTLATAQFD
jgi:hypothetical protein